MTGSNELREEARRSLAGLRPDVREDEIAYGFAPGRVNLIGAHVDYNQGIVLPVPLRFGTWVAAAGRPDRRVRIASANLGDRFEGDLDAIAPEAEPRYAAYAGGMALALRERGLRIGGFDLGLAGDLPIGAGLSSSASLLVAVGRALASLFGLPISDRDLAMTAHSAETGFVGVQCGVMDPMAAALGRAGHALLLDCRTLETKNIAYDSAQVGVLVLDSGTRRTLETSRYNERVAECRVALEAVRRIRPEVVTLRDAREDDLERIESDVGEVVSRRARHVVAEIARVREFIERLEASDYEACGELMVASHASSRDLYETSTPALDYLVERACREPSVYGARLTGAGWGGCVVALVRRDDAVRVGKRVAEDYRRRFQVHAQPIIA